VGGGPTRAWVVVRTVAAPPSILDKCGGGGGGFRVVVCGVVLVVACVVWVCSCCVFVCVTCFSSHILKCNIPDHSGRVCGSSMGLTLLCVCVRDLLIFSHGESIDILQCNIPDHSSSSPAADMAERRICLSAPRIAATREVAWLPCSP